MIFPGYTERLSLYRDSTWFGYTERLSFYLIIQRDSVSTWLGYTERLSLYRDSTWFGYTERLSLYMIVDHGYTEKLSLYRDSTWFEYTERLSLYMIVDHGYTDRLSLYMIFRLSRWPIFSVDDTERLYIHDRVSLYIPRPHGAPSLLEREWII